MKKKGFTLIELLVVIAIIGILSSVVLVSLNSSREKARDARRISDLGQIQTALALSLDSNSTYPTALTDLVAQGYFSSAEPKDPLNASDYKYATNGTSYHLGAILEQAAASVLDSDADCDSSATPPCVGFGVAPTGGVGFAGTDPVYDLLP